MKKQLSLEEIIACGVDPEWAIANLPQLNEWLTSLPDAACWQHLTQETLKPSDPFAFHQLLYNTTFADWNYGNGHPPAWYPSEAEIAATHISQLMAELQISSYSDLHTWSVQHRGQFWQVMIEKLGIRFQQPYTQIVDLSQGVESPQWLVGAQLNIVESCFLAPETQTAIIFQPEGGAIARLTYGELHSLVNRISNGLVGAGFQPGDAIAIVLPMTVEAIAIYLGIVQAGCVVVSIADSFAPPEISTRLQITNAKAVFTQDIVIRAGKTLRLYEKVVAAQAPTAIVLVTDPTTELCPSDRPWQAFLSNNSQFDAIPRPPAAHTNILFSSGTTGEPKAIPWTQTTPIKCAADGYLHQDIHPGDVVAWPTNLGWMMGPWLIYASLINQAAIALDYGVPTTREFGEFIQDAKVTMLGVVPSLVNTWRTSQCMQGLDWSAIKTFSSTGECSNPQDMLFLMSLAGYKPIVEYCGGTEIGGAYITGTLVQPCAPATFTTPALGLDIVILDPDGQITEQGEALIIPPSIGLSTELLNKDHYQIYFADTPVLAQNSQAPLTLRRHGDRLERLPNGYYRAQGRVDDTMNLGGIKVSATEIERVLNTIAEIKETAAIAISPPEGGPGQLVVYAVLTPDNQKSLPALQSSLQTAIAQQLNPLFKIRELIIVEALPRTASNKVMRRVLRDQYSQHLSPLISKVSPL
jgi:acetyl-CoA synthetase